MPIGAKRFPSSFPPAGRKSISKYDRIDGAGARSGYAVESEGFFFEQAVKYAPSESTMTAAALQRQIDNLLSSLWRVRARRFILAF